MRPMTSGYISVLPDTPGYTFLKHANHAFLVMQIEMKLALLSMTPGYVFNAPNYIWLHLCPGRYTWLHFLRAYKSRVFRHAN